MTERDSGAKRRRMSLLLTTFFNKCSSIVVSQSCDHSRCIFNHFHPKDLLLAEEPSGRNYFGVSSQGCDDGCKGPELDASYSLNV